MTHDERILVVGGDGTIGAAIARALRERGVEVLTSSRRGTADSLSLDLENLDPNWQPPDGVRVAYLCAAIASVAGCRDEPDRSRRVNVDAVTRLARRLVETGAFVVYPSTNLVFDGSQANCSADEPPSPRTEYGRQRADVERQLLDLGDAAAIVRLSKVLTPRFPLFANWQQQLQARKQIQAFSDVMISPVPLSTVVESLAAVGQTRSPGMWQLSGDADVSYEEVAQRLAARHRCSADLVVATLAAGTQHGPEPIPRYTTLDTGRLTDELDIRIPGVWTTIDDVFDSLTT